MDRKRTKRSGMFRAGLAVVVIGALLGITGITAGSAGATKPLRIKVTLCHRTNATTNPYREITVSVDATNGEFVGPDHTGHGGPAFDFTGDPDVLYPPPHNGDQWGDIIPPYDFADGHFPGMNWPEGLDPKAPPPCQIPDEVDDCPEGQQWDDANGDSFIDPDECVTPVECPADTDWVDANGNEIEEESECVQPAVFVCPTGTEGSDTNGNDVVDDGECNAPEAVLGEVVTPAQPAQLPHTGSNTGPMALAGAGLILIGSGALSASRRKTASIGR